MKVAFYIARRYLFSKKSHNAINIISLVSVCGVVVVTAALVCALSVMNGFNQIVFSMFSGLDPDLKIMPTMGKVFDPSSDEIQKVRRLPGVANICEVLQDNALVRYKDRQDICVIKGVGDNYSRLTTIDSILVDGIFTLSDEVADYATLGIGLAVSLAVNAHFISPLEIYAPKRDEKVNLANPSTSFNLQYAYINAVFQTNQQAYDDGFLIVPLSLTRTLFNYETEVSALELKLVDGANPETVKKQIKKLLGDDYKVSDRFEQQDVAYKMMQSEKWMIFLILCFILTISLFNMVGSLSMLMIEKQNDVRTLRNMGANNSLIRRIFLFEGWMISGFGAFLGILVGIVLCLLQQNLGLIKMGTAGSFVIDKYPVLVASADIIIILATVLLVGFLSAWYPVYRLGDRWIKDK